MSIRSSCLVKLINCFPNYFTIQIIPLATRVLYRCIKLPRKFKKKIKLDDVKRWFRKQQTYTLHKSIRIKFYRRKTIAAGIDYQWQADLADMSSTSKFNDKYRFLLCIIDIFSKYAWVVPIKDKTGKTLVHALKSLLKSGRKPKRLQTDKGTECKNKDFQNFLKSKKIHFFTIENPETKASIVERFQRTLKSRMWKYFTHHRTLRYFDILSKRFQRTLKSRMWKYFTHHRTLRYRDVLSKRLQSLVSS